MNLADAIANFTGATKELKEATAALTAAQADNATLVARVAELEPVAARVPDLESNLSTVTAERDTAQARVTELEAEAATFDQRVTEAANLKVAEIVAANGHKPVETAVQTGGEEEPKPGAGLTGVRKAAAILASRMPAQRNGNDRN